MRKASPHKNKEMTTSGHKLMLLIDRTQEEYKQKQTGCSHEHHWQLQHFNLHTLLRFKVVFLCFH